MLVPDFHGKTKLACTYPACLETMTIIIIVLAVALITALLPVL